ncbi:MAG: cupin domain-containing protein [Chloroflexota bacterium]|jgi:quercetin dioxygenase-like cupin family protein
MAGARAPIVRRSGEGEGIGLGRLLVGDDAAEGRFALLELEGRPGVQVPAHIHRDADELFYVLEGRLMVQVAGDELEAGPGDLVLVPRGTAHGHRTPGEGRVRWLTLFAPGGAEGYFRARAHAVARARELSDAARVGLDYGGLDPAEHDRLRERYGIVIVDDPPAP